MGGGHNFLTYMNRSSQDTFLWQKSLDSIKNSQSCDIVCHLALLWSKGVLYSVNKGSKEK